MSGKGKKRYVDEPETLFELAMAVVVTNTAAVHNQASSLPIEVWERFLEAYQLKFRVDDDIAHAVSESRTRIRCIKLRKAEITNHGLAEFMRVQPRELQLVDCALLTTECLRHISENSQNLETLKVINTNIMHPRSRSRNPDAPVVPKLRSLTLRQRGLEIITCPTATPLDQLTHLDLSECQAITGIVGAKLNHLETLILHAVPNLQTIIDWIVELKNLRHLDISQTNDRIGKFHLPNLVLLKLVNGLPLLSRLDISGTNLAGSGAASEEGAPVGGRCDIPGLASRVDKPLAFLGLYGTHNAACTRHDIPALKISGDANEEQVLTAGEAYAERPEVLIRVLNDLYYMFRYEDNRQVSRALELVLNSMERHISEKTVQISGSATLFYIVKDKEVMTVRTRRRIITALLVAMETHIDDETMMRNGCLGLTRFNIPADVLFQYERMATVLLTGVVGSGTEDFVRRMGIYLLNSLACQVDTHHKQYLGKSGAIGTMLNIISERLENNTCDSMLETAWSTLWNMTDEMPDNCERFLHLNGLHLFLSCLKRFPNNDDQLRNMMGLLGNVAEHQSLRARIMTPNLLRVFYELLNSSRDGIEVSYNAGGVLAHILSDGEQAWTAKEPARADVAARLADVIESWDIIAERNINYRSFRPILNLLRAHHTPQCQHWAAWALANLTSVYPEKYCKLIISEGGLELLQSVVAHDAPYARVKELCNTVIENVTKEPQTMEMEDMFSLME